MSDSKSCILVVGSTGTGKSTLIGLCTGAVVNTSGGTAECTLDIQAFSAAECEEGPVWVDSVGFDGTDSSRSDEEAFQYILRFLQSNAISHVVGIIWTVNPDARESARLQEQAKLINKFHAGSVWRNVIIVVKKSSGNARSDGAGALAAAARYGDAQEVLTVGYTLLEQLESNKKEFWEKQTSDDRMNMDIRKSEEAKTLIKDNLQSLPPSFQVVFCDSQCADCGVVSDPRLFPLACHTSKETVHPLAAVPVHRGAPVPTHPAQHMASRHTAGTAYRRERTGGNRVTGRKYREVPYMACCNNDPSHPGCQVYHPCCQKPQGAQGCKNIYSCCGGEVSGSNPGCARRYPCCSGEEGSTGCRDQCSYCKVTWGTFDTNISCIGRNHQHVNKI